MSGRFVGLATPIEMIEAETDTELRAGCFKHFEALGHHLFADTVSGDNSYSVGIHDGMAW
jgi:hypothetical protein